MKPEYNTRWPEADRGSGANVFVVEDEPWLRQLEVQTVEHIGFSCREFPSAEQAMQAFMHADPKPRLIISDFCLAEMTGLQLLESCKRMQPELKTLLVSGTVDHTILEDASVPVDGFVPKPFDVAAFLGKITSLMQEQKEQEPTV